MSQLRKIVTLHELPEPERAMVTGSSYFPPNDLFRHCGSQDDVPAPYGRHYLLRILEGERKGQTVCAHRSKVVFDEPNETMQAINAHRYYQQARSV